MSAQETIALPEYAQPLGAYLNSLPIKEKIRQRLTYQRDNDLPGDKETVAAQIYNHDVYYSYSDDPQVFRRGNNTEEWLIKHDQWFDRCLPVADTYLKQIGAYVEVPKDVEYFHLRMRACIGEVTDTQWNNIVLPVEKALAVLEEYPIREGYMTLPTEKFNGTRLHKVLAVPRRIRDAAEQVRVGLRCAGEVGIPHSLWSRVYSGDEAVPYEVTRNFFYIYPDTPSKKEI